MKRGELYRVYKGSSTDKKDYRVFVIVSRQVLINSKYSTVTCAPIYSNYIELSTQVKVGIEEGLKHESSIHCDDLVSIRKSKLRNYIGILSSDKITDLNRSLKIALELEDY